MPDPIASKVAALSSALSDSQPLYAKISKAANGDVVASNTYTQANVLEAEAFQFAQKLLAKEYIEIDN